ncbi:MAG: peroxiredoxin [Chthoniobacteraceae bacterium]
MKTISSLMSLLAFLGFTAFANAEPLAVGTAAPDISAVDQDGKTISFKDIYAKGATLVYFYPKADTPGCTKQGCSLRDSWADLQGKDIQVIGVSEDDVEAQKKFHEKYNFPFVLIADHDGKVAKAFGVPTLAGFAKRQSFLIKDGKVVWNMLKASTDTHAKDVLAAYEALDKK